MHRKPHPSFLQKDTANSSTAHVQETYFAVIVEGVVYHRVLVQLLACSASAAQLPGNQ